MMILQGVSMKLSQHMSLRWMPSVKEIRSDGLEVATRKVCARVRVTLATVEHTHGLLGTAWLSCCEGSAE
jgi:hypothetical protein